MFTRNWYKAIATNIFAVAGTLEFTAVDGATVRKIGNKSSFIAIYNNGDDYATPSIHKLRTALNTHGGVIIGTGTTPPTQDDCVLSGDLITTYNYSSQVSTMSDDDGIEITAVYTITNTGDSAFTIGEIGLITNLTNTGTSSASYKALIERTVLETPITIEPGGVGQVTYTLCMNYPVA